MHVAIEPNLSPSLDSPSFSSVILRMPISSASAVGSGGGTPPEHSVSCIVGKTVVGSHTLTIDGFSRSKSTRFMSSTFTVGGHAWSTELVLLGIAGGWIFMLPRHCYTHCCTAGGEEFTASFSFSLLDHNGEASYSEAMDGVRKFSEKKVTGVGLVALVGTKFLESMAAIYLPGDCLRVRCDVTIYKEPHCEDSDVPSRLVAVPPSDILEQLGRLLSSGVGADLAFEVAGGETFAVHRHILNVRSPILLEEIVSAAGVMMETKTEATTTSCDIQICGMEAVVVKALLHYIYTDSLPEIDEGDMVQQLIAAANRYSLDRLKLICEDMLCRRVDASRVVTTLALAEEYNCHRLKKACFLFLMSGSNLKAAMAAGGFEILRNSCPSILQELLTMVDRR